MKPAPLTLVTHPRPHIDDICGFWLLMRFWEPAENAKFKFVSSSTQDPGDPKQIFVGVGRGRFDEHKGDLGESAASLVFAFIKEQNQKISAVDMDALTRLVTWVRDEDMNLHDKDTHREIGISSLLRSHFDLNGHNSTSLVRFGMTLLDDMLQSLRNDSQLAADWTQRVEFDSPWGKAVAIETSAYGADDYAYAQGFPLLVLLSPARGFRGYRASARSNIDLSGAYQTLLRLDAKAEWYLHHSRKLLLCGSDVAPDTKLSKLSLRDLIRVLQPLDHNSPNPLLP